MAVEICNIWRALSVEMAFEVLASCSHFMDGGKQFDKDFS